MHRLLSTEPAWVPPTEEEIERPIRVVFGVWAFCIAASFVAPFVAPFITRALIRPGGMHESMFVGLAFFFFWALWQLFTLLLAIVAGVITFARRQDISRELRRLGYVPVVVSGTLVAGLSVLLLLL